MIPRQDDPLVRLFGAAALVTASDRIARRRAVLLAVALLAAGAGLACLLRLLMLVGG